MTDQKFADAQTSINELNTEAANQRRIIDEGIQTARKINAAVRESQAKLRVIDERSNALSQAIKTHLNEKVARTHAEQLAREAAALEAKKKAEEAEAAKKE